MEMTATFVMLTEILLVVNNLSTYVCNGAAIGPVVRTQGTVAYCLPQIRRRRM